MSQALYRRYRPETFADVIGQQHVTEPLMQALRHDRTNHAYLFSGPRGCGKTTSARILARCLNCEQGPTPTPCGVCQSCQDLATGGPGSLDVIEIDAATHGLVDDARELRERAFYSPASSRYKVYIIDEAHMLGPGASNALLKVVEEPPPHVKFVFATTEPEKVIATIRSRVHHYPFRLVPPGELMTYLALLCEREAVTVEPGVLSLVVRAGRGSVRDSLSVLDQLMAGAGDSGVGYALAISLLGFTDASLLDDTVEACAAGDAAAVFGIVEQVVEAGHDPRRFAEDLLERLRDLIIIAAVADDAASILGEHPADELERMRQQAAHFGAAELSRAADIINTGLIDMRGATAPRLQLELMCARMLLPDADTDERGLVARLDRLERRLAISASTAAAEPAPSRAAPARTPAASPSPSPAPATPSPPQAPATPTPAPEQPTPAPEQPAPAPEQPAPVTAAAPPDVAAAEPAGGAALSLVSVRSHWPDVLTEVAKNKKTTWSLISQNAQVLDLHGDRLTLGFSSEGLRDVFLGRSDHQEYVRQALITVLGVDWKVEAIVDPSVTPAVASVAPIPPTAATSSVTKPPAGGRAAAMDKVAAETASTGADGSAQPSAEAEPSPDDPDADDGEVSHQDLLARELGARVIGEYENT